MRRSALLFAAVPLLGGALLAGGLRALDGEPISALPKEPEGEPIPSERWEIGRELFDDGRLSKNGEGKISCAYCHQLRNGGAQAGMRFSVGASGEAALVNTPSVLTAAYNFRQTWGGMAPSLEDVVDRPIRNPALMGSEWKKLLPVLRPIYGDRLSKVYGAPFDEKLVLRALADYLRVIVPRDAPFDEWFRGGRLPTGLNPEARAGYETFKRLGCASCHQGQNIGGNMYAEFGAFSSPFWERDNDAVFVKLEEFLGKGSEAVQLFKKDRKGNLGLAGDPKYDASKKIFDDDAHRFKVPSLRNITRTAPYFHNGATDDIKTAIRMMAFFQLGKTLKESEVDELVAFFKTLEADPPLSRVKQ